MTRSRFVSIGSPFSLPFFFNWAVVVTRFNDMRELPILSAARDSNFPLRALDIFELSNSKRRSSRLAKM